MWSMIQAAGWPIWPLIIASVVALALIFERLYSLRQSMVAPAGMVDRVLTQFREVSIGHLLAQNGDHMVAADIVLAVMNAARWIDADRKLAPVARGNMRLARYFGCISNRPFRSLRHLAHRHAADDPSIGAEPVMDAFIMSTQDISRDALRRRGEAARMQATVDRRAHMADDVGPHGSFLTY